MPELRGVRNRQIERNDEVSAIIVKNSIRGGVGIKGVDTRSALCTAKAPIRPPCVSLIVQRLTKV